MKIVLVVLLSFAICFSNAQVARLSVDNPAPRVGNEIQVRISLSKYDLDYDMQKMNSQKFKEMRENNLGGGEMRFSQIASDTGNLTIGPFKFMVNNTEIVSDVIKVKVYPKLPPINNGVWARFVRIKDQEYLIVEQRTPISWTEDSQGRKVLSTEGVEFTFIDNYVTRELGFFIENSGSWVDQETVEKADLYLGGSTAHKTTKYKITRLKWAKGNLMLDKSMFKNFPKRSELYLE